MLSSAGYTAEAGEQLREAILWLPVTEDGYLLRVQVLIALAELRPMEARQAPPDNRQAEGRNEGRSSLQAHEESLRLFDLAVQWGGLCNKSTGVKVDTLLKKAWFCQGAHGALPYLPTFLLLFLSCVVL